MADQASESAPNRLELANLKPYFSITILECLSDDWDRDFEFLCRFLRREAEDPGQSSGVRITGEINLSGDADQDNSSLVPLSDFDFDRLYAITRSRTQAPSWAVRESGIFDVINQLAIAFKRRRLIAIRTDLVSVQKLLRWVSKPTTPLQPLPPDILMGTFIGDGSGLWLQGTHRQRATKADNKALYGIRLQEALDAIEDSSYAMSAMQIVVRPDSDDSLINGKITISPDKSSMSFKSMSSIAEFAAVTAETLEVFEKSFTSESSPDLPYPGLAFREKDLANVFDAFDVRVATPEEIRANPNFDDNVLEVADELRGSLLSVSGQEGSPAVIIEVGKDSAKTGALKVEPVPVKGAGFELSVRTSGRLTDEIWTCKVRDLISENDLLSIFYESGHSYAERRICRQQLSMQAYRNITFEDFSGYNVCREKPKVIEGRSLHDSIGAPGDDSLFAWVLNRYRTGWLLCDDGSDELADFLHLDNCGELTVIHVKGAHNRGPTRRIAVTSFEVLVSQAEKNVHRLRGATLAEVLKSRNSTRLACWLDGGRIDGPDDFIERLEIRTSRDKTSVVLVQPHLLRSVHSAAREALDEERPTSNSHSLVLLETLLHSTRRTVTSLWDDMYVIGCA